MKADKKAGLCLIKEWQGHFRMLVVLAEMVRELIVNRAQAGLQAARKRDRIGGRFRVGKKRVERALKLYKSKDYSVAEITELTGVSKATLYRRIKEIVSRILMQY